MDGLASVTVGPDGAVKDVRYFGMLDFQGKFAGTFQGTHPVLRVATTNDSLDDRGTSAFLFRPRAQYMDFTGSSRESLTDQNPWIYRLSDEELKREGKEMSDAEAATALANEGKPGFQRPKKVMDLRRYLYVDLALENPWHTQVAVAVKLKGQDKWYRSDFGDTGVDALWSGTGVRTSVPLPAGVKPSDIEAVRVLNEGGMGVTLDGVHKAFMLDDAYEPQYLNLPAQKPTSVGRWSSTDVPNRTQGAQ
jgi:hypothetical protein